MADRLIYTLRSSLASNTGGPYTATWDRAVVTSAGTIRSVVGVSPSIASNGRQNTVDVYRQADSPSAGSNTGATVLVSPLTLAVNGVAVSGTIRAANARVAVGDVLELRTDMGTLGAQPGFRPVVVSVEVERD